MLKFRLIYLTLIPIVIVTAFATRSGAAWIPGFVAEYGGDTLWALMVFMVVRVIAPRWPLLRSVLLTLTISYLCEISQLYHAPWIDAIRSYRLGVILLGDTFVWSDLVCYTVGILVGGLSNGRCGAGRCAAAAKSLRLRGTEEIAVRTYRDIGTCSRQSPPSPSCSSTVRQQRFYTRNRQQCDRHADGGLAIDSAAAWSEAEIGAEPFQRYNPAATATTPKAISCQRAPPC